MQGRKTAEGLIGLLNKGNSAVLVEVSIHPLLYMETRVVECISTAMSSADKNIKPQSNFTVYNYFMKILAVRLIAYFFPEN